MSPLPSIGPLSSIYTLLALLAIHVHLLPSMCAAEHSLSQVTFERVLLSHEYYSEAANYGDFNNDGHRDLVSGPYWFEGPDFDRHHQFYPAEAVTDLTAYADNFLCFVYDINGDGWDDVLVVDIPSEESPVHWYENPRGRPRFWRKHLALPNIDNESPLFADLTDDGRPELIGTRDGRLGYATWDVALPQKPWTWHPISEERDWHCYTHGLGIGDVTGNGRNDIVMADGWLEQVESTTEHASWRWHPFRFAAGGAQMFVYDVDGDGANDIITSHNAHGWGLNWFEQIQTDDGEISFRKHAIMGSRSKDNPYGVRFSQLHALDLADIDGDGLKDIVTGKCYFAHNGTDPGAHEPAVLYYFRLVREAGEVRFVPQLIDNDSGVGRLIRAVDMDGDGLTDVIVGNKKGIYLFRQLARAATDEVREAAESKAEVRQSERSAAIDNDDDRDRFRLASDFTSVDSEERSLDSQAPSVPSGDKEELVREFDARRFFRSGEDRSRKATPAGELRMPDGFRAELLYTVPLEQQGSWVCLTTDPHGRLITSAQHGGLYRITLAAGVEGRDPVNVELLNVEVGSAQGLLWAFDSLYVVGNIYAATEGEEQPGLYRLRDTNGDDTFDEVKLLRNFDGGLEEHGPHAVVLAPDGRSLYVIGGNVCFPEPVPERSRIAARAGIDRLAGGLSHEDWLWQPNRVGGWVCRVDPDGKEFELIAMGLRNAYDLAFNSDGELFTFDSDMEWDAGTPWYRPTRVNHIISGADFGWRPTNCKWPDYYVDSFGSVVDVGFSSPTGMSFGYGARFPENYQRALFVGDWSMGYIYAVHLEPQRASYQGTIERFVSGAPLPVTDLVINPNDGAMYFTVGGRGVTSALYRITYQGEEPTKLAPDIQDPQGRSHREVRRSLEALHREIGSSAVNQAWPYLSHEDRAIRHAARIALEHQPSELWRERALGETQPRSVIAAMVALARCGEDSCQRDIVEALGNVRWDSIGTGNVIDLVRAHALVISRMGSLSDAARQRILHNLSSHFPYGEPRVDQLLAEVLTSLQAPGAIPRTLKLLEEAPTQEEQIHYATCISTLTTGWTPELKRQFLEWFRRAQALRGGVSFDEFFEEIRTQFIDRLTPQEKELFAELLVRRPIPDPYAELKSRPHVNDWTVSELLPKLADSMRNGDVENGRKVFAAAMCYRCHRYDGRGGIAGPDLTTVGRRFNLHDLLEATLEPSRVISDQYRSVTILTTDGKFVTGKLTDQSGNYLLVMKDALNPANITMVERDQVDEIVPSEVSLMPEGLLNSFTADEIADLFAFLLSLGDDGYEAFHEQP